MILESLTGCLSPCSTEVFTAEKVVEYVWPLEGVGEHYFIQEQISQYLGIMSFKRRYPDLRRRPIDMQERDYLKEKGLVSDIACDLGLFKSVLCYGVTAHSYLLACVEVLILPIMKLILHY